MYEPEGSLHLADARFEAVDERRTRVSGARWQPALSPTIKIEGAGSGWESAPSSWQDPAIPR